MDSMLTPNCSWFRSEGTLKRPRCDSLYQQLREQRVKKDQAKNTCSFVDSEHKLSGQRVAGGLCRPLRGSLAKLRQSMLRTQPSEHQEPQNSRSDHLRKL